ncbi:hypothetical protein B0A67_16260 [Flavobacterium aquidurense]|uniref:hypothetical protein n=1 Tax=Flavobacterium aquidurense TaxID=362413 RepID=UPI00091EB0F7|nr:hypothetical protein [Flavobacterium aquidurense]OXA70343.1 hypothetical protein B0A67_16260 [Flavobacterium aquidurense]SHH33670.1 hypothetical protein SAMN05444481_11562 [Flavobacterium frigidimaris]
MKKITFLLFAMFTVLVHSQEKKFFQSSPEKLTAEQLVFITSVNKYYPEFALVKNIVNIYSPEKEIAESYIEYPKPPNDCDDYLITLQSDNKRLDYEFNYGAGNGNLINRGSIYIVGTDVYKVDISIKGKSKNFFQLYKNGKEVFSENPYKGLN